MAFVNAYSGTTVTLFDQLAILPRGLGGAFNPAPALTDAAKSTLTGVDTSALEAALFGKDIPLFVGGQALMGCRIIEGPFLTTGGSPSQNLVSFIATCAM